MSFFLEVVIEGFDLSFEKESVIPVGNCNAGRCHALASDFDKDVRYFPRVSVISLQAIQ